MKKKMLAGMIFLCIIKIFAFDPLTDIPPAADILPRPPADESFNAMGAITSQTNPNKQKRGWGVASTMVLYAGKVRTSVRWVYDEVKYWFGVVEAYKDLEKFFTDGISEYASARWDNAKRLFTTWDGDIIGKLEHFANFTEGVARGRAVTELERRLDVRLARLEHNWDKLLPGNTFTHTVGPFRMEIGYTQSVIIPNTKEVLNYIDEVVFDRLLEYLDDNTNWNDWMARIAPGGGEVRPEVPELPVRPMDRYEQVIVTNQIVAAQAMANSMAYRQWAQRAMEQLERLDSQFNEIFKNNINAGGINSIEFAAAWYAIENVNAYNKRIRHEIEEAKLLSALIGTNIYERAMFRANDMMFTHESISFFVDAMAMDD